MNNDYFNHNYYIECVKKETNLSNIDINKIREKYQNYANNNIFSIPITIWLEPTPYSPIRIDPRTMRMYVPNKAKLVAQIRDLIMNQVGPINFSNGFFPKYTETILKSSLYIPTPKNFSKEAKYIAEEKLLRPIVTPDTDNVEKILNDAIKSFLIYDDAQITTDITEKYYSIVPRMEITIFYNAAPIKLVHESIIKHREQKWQEMWNKGETPVQLHLYRYYNILTKHM